MKKVKKGQAGYIRSEKIRRFIIMVIMFAIPIGIFASALIITGTRRNLMTILAMVGIVPAARFAVSWIMIQMQKDAPAQLVENTDRIAAQLLRGYELTVTAYEGQMPLDAAVVCGSELTCCSLNGKKDKFAFMEKHIAKILAENGCRGVNVKIFDQEKHFYDRIKMLAADPGKYRMQGHAGQSAQEPETSKEDVIWQTLLAISV